MEYDRLMLLL